MRFTGIHRSTLYGRALGVSDEAFGAWVKISILAMDRESLTPESEEALTRGGVTEYEPFGTTVIRGCSGWGDLVWAQACGVSMEGLKAAEAGGLVTWVGADLIVNENDLWGLSKARSLRTRGRLGGRPRTKENQPLSESLGFAQVKPSLSCAKAEPKLRITPSLPFPSLPFPSNSESHQNETRGQAARKPDPEVSGQETPATVLPEPITPGSPPDPPATSAPTPKVKAKRPRTPAGDLWEQVDKLWSIWEDAHVEAGKPRPAKWLEEQRLQARTILKRLANHPDPTAEAARRIDIALNQPVEYWKGKALGIGAVLKCLDQFASPAKAEGKNSWEDAWIKDRDKPSTGRRVF